MLVASLIAAAYTFTASATGVAKGDPVEFLFTGKGSDRDYEAMFQLDRPLDVLCSDLEKAGLIRGRPVSVRDCILWPEGCRVRLEPDFAEFIAVELPDGIPAAPLIYCGGTRNEKGGPLAAEDQPNAFLAFYSLDQAPFQFDALYHQGDVYGAFKAKKSLKKGDQVKFTISWDDGYQPSRISVCFKPGQLKDGIASIRSAADKGQVSVKVSLDPELSVGEAQAVAQALRTIDSPAVKINGIDSGDFFYQAFLPEIKWTDRQQRMQQPFEIRFSADGKPNILYIAEDWTVPGDDPKLTEQPITVDELVKFPKTNTAFIFAKASEKIGLLQDLKRKFPQTVLNWYVFTE